MFAGELPQGVERRLAGRARIVLLAGEGRPAGVIAERVGRSAETVRRTRPPDTPEGVRRERWTHRELVERVGMSELSPKRTILRDADVRPHLTEYWVMSELGPDFDAQAAEVWGL